MFDFITGRLFWGSDEAAREEGFTGEYPARDRVEAMIKAWNARVQPGQTVFILGPVFPNRRVVGLDHRLKDLNGRHVLVKNHVLTTMADDDYRDWAEVRADNDFPMNDHATLDMVIDDRTFILGTDIDPDVPEQIDVSWQEWSKRDRAPLDREYLAVYANASGGTL